MAMKLGLATAFLALASLVCEAGSAEAALSPVTRITELLQSLAKKVERDLKKEEELFTHYECWAKSVISQKTASNEAAKSRRQSLQTYIADLDAGRIELTSERVDLEKEIAGLLADKDQAEALRAKEKADYEVAKAEMEQAVTALRKAIGVLETGAKPAILLLLRGGDTVASRLADAQAVSLVLEVSRDSLSKADSDFLRRVLNAEVPVADWKKLNRKPDFKEKYEARSGEILRTLKSLLQTFESKLESANAKEAKALELHTTLMGAKSEQEGKAKEALSAMEAEGAARGLSKSEAQAEAVALAAQVEADEKHIQDTRAALDTKTTEWTQRKKTRIDEIAAIGRAVAILRSDDARDLFKRSFASQGYSFLQVRAASARAVAAHKVVAAGHFDKVIESIDKMVAVLESEEEEDLQRKEGCETARAEDTRQAITLSRAMDDLTDTMERLKTEIAELQTSVSEKREDISKIKDELVEAKRVRDDEHAEWVKSDADDHAAAQLVGQAIAALEEFYSKQAGLLQKKGQREPVKVAAGKAPPPTTWDAPYAGAQEEKTGIVSILTMVKDDIQKDLTAAKHAEDNSQKAYDTFKTDNEKQIADLETAISQLEGTISDKQVESQDAQKDRLTKNGELDAVLKKIKDAAPGCDHFLVNHEVRLKNRQTELDGLKQAKHVLQGATFQS